MTKTKAILPIILTIILTGMSISAYAEIDERFQGVESECKEFETTIIIPNGTKTTTILACNWLIEETHLDIITVEQPDLTDEEQEVIDEANECREDDNCKQPDLQCTLPMKLNILGDRCITPPPKVECDEICEELKTVELLKDIFCENRTPTTAQEQDLCNSIKEISECQQGILKLETIQETRSFLTTLFIPEGTSAYDYATSNAYLLKLQLAREECTATWTELYGNILSAEYAGKVPTSLDTNPYHADFVTTSEETQQNWKRLFAAHVLPPGMLDFEGIRAQNDVVCSSTLYHNSFKKQQGCDDKYLLDYPSYYAKNYVVNPTYAVNIRDVGGAYQDYLTYKQDEAGYKPDWQVSKYVTIYNIYTSSDDINLSLSVKDKR